LVLYSWEVKKFIIVAHSIGGVLALKIASLLPDRVVGLVAVGAAIPEQGNSFLSAMTFAKRTLMRVLLRIFGTRPPESAIRQGLCNDLTPEQSAAIVRDFVPESIRLYTDRAEAAAPQYTEILQSGHLPMMSKPKELRRALQSFLSLPEVK
jgi:pimeloyl-ACP methyl ester carboxylesterase